MNKRNNNRKSPHLGIVLKVRENEAKIRAELRKLIRSRDCLERLYVEGKVEHLRTGRRLDIAMAQSGFNFDCAEYLRIALLEIQEINRESINELLKGYMRFRKEEGLKLEDKINALLKEPIPLGMIKDGAIYDLGKYDSKLDKLEDWLNWMKQNRR